MKTINNAKHQWNEIVFENRNKSYGAYDLRETYEERAGRALILCLACITFIIVAPLTINYFLSKAIEPIIERTIIIEPKIFTEHFDKKKVTEQQQQKKEIQGAKKSATLAVNDSVINKSNIDSTLAAATYTGPAASEGLPGPEDGEPGISNPPATSPAGPPPVYSGWQLDQNPEFPGGNEAFYKYLRTHVQYPPAARENGVEATAYVSFVIDAEGTVTNVKILRAAGYGFDEEATQVASKMPRWKAGIYHGGSVSTIMQLPVKFVLVK